MKLLLVEDDERLASALVRGMRRLGHRVDPAPTVAEARWLAAESSYSVYVLDVMLPDGDGFELCKALREVGDWTPVLMLTARDSVTDRVRGLDVGADDYLGKPFAFAELVARLRALDRRGPSTRPTTLAVGSLVIDPAGHRAQVGESALLLTSRQFALLEFFARHPDQVLTRAMILDELWDFAFDGDPRIVDVYIAGLRRLLRAHPGAPEIDTVRGAGYALRPRESAVVAASR